MAKKTAAKKKPVVQKAKKAVKKASKKAVKKAAKKALESPVKTKKTAAAKASPKAARKVRAKVKAKAKPKATPKATPKAKVKAKVKAKATPKAKVKAKAKSKVAKPAARKAAPARKVALVKQAAPVKKVAPAAPARKVPSLDRDRRVMRESDLVPMPPSSLVPNRHASAASTGADELRVKLANHTSTGPELTGGDVDADWQLAETSGDGAPGGDNPTPDQDVVEEIGKALGVQYDDDEELRGGDEIADRDHDRWELDPASSEDFKDR